MPDGAENISCPRCGAALQSRPELYALPMAKLPLEDNTTANVQRSTVVRVLVCPDPGCAVVELRGVRAASA